MTMNERGIIIFKTGDISGLCYNTILFSHSVANLDSSFRRRMVALRSEWIVGQLSKMPRVKSGEERNRIFVAIHIDRSHTNLTEVEKSKSECYHEATSIVEPPGSVSVVGEQWYVFVAARSVVGSATVIFFDGSNVNRPMTNISIPGNTSGMLDSRSSRTISFFWFYRKSLLRCR